VKVGRVEYPAVVKTNGVFYELDDGSSSRATTARRSFLGERRP
jgi:hypothetical protein